MKRRVMARLVLLAATATAGSAASLCAQSSPAPVFKLTAFKVQGSERYGQAAVLAASGLKLGGLVSSDDLQAAMQRLSDTGAFASVQYQADDVGTNASVTFKLADSNQFVACRFANFVWEPDAQIRAELRSRVPLFVGEISTSGHMADAVSAALDAMLRERGIQAKADYTPWFEPGASAPSALVFRIHGPSLPIREIQFTGTRGLDQPTLTAAVQPLLGRDYDQLAVQEFVKKAVASLYHERGYLRASLQSPEAQLIDGGAAGPVRVVIAATEGMQYRLGSVKWSGNRSIPTEDLAAGVKLEAGQPADQSRLQEAANMAADLYSSHGFVLAHVTTEATFEDADSTVNFTFSVDEGDQYRMGQLLLNGVDPQHVARILHDVRLRAGDPYDASYWGKFLAEVAHDLPHSMDGWDAQFNPAVNRDSKTVDVTVNFLPVMMQ
jgi:outer membrane protein assembly factor BamA